MAEFPVGIKLKAIDGVSRILKSINGNFDQLAKKVGKATGNIGKKLTVGITAPVAAAAAGSIAAFSQFDNSFRNVENLLTDTSFGAVGLGEGIAKLRKEILAVAKSSPHSVELLNKALFDTVASGIEAGKAVNVVNQAAKLATAGFVDLGVATNAINDAIDGFGFAAEDANKVAAKFFTIQKFGISIAEVEGKLGKVAPLANLVGVSFEQLLGSLAAGKQAGMATADVFKSIETVMGAVIKPTEDAKKAAKALGIQFDSKALKNEGLVNFMKKITENAKRIGVDPVLAFEKLFGSVDALTFASAISGKTLETFTGAVKALGDETAIASQFNTAFANQTGSLTNQLTIMKNKIMVLAINIGEKLAPVVSKIVSGFGRLITFLEENPKFAELAGVIALVAAALGPVLVAVGAALTMLPALSAAAAALGVGLLPMIATIGLIPLAIAAVATAGYFLIKHWDAVKTFFISSVTAIWGIFDNVFAQIAVAILLPFIGYPIVIIKNWSAISGFFISLVQGIWGIFDSKFAQITTAILLPFIGIPIMIMKNWEVLKGFFADLFDGLIPDFIKDKLGITAKVGLNNKLPDFRDKFGVPSGGFGLPDSAEARRLERTVPQFGEEMKAPMPSAPKKNESKVTVDFKNMPSGTKVKTSATNNDTMFDINTGLQGAGI